MGIRQSFNNLGNNTLDWVIDRLLHATANYIPYDAISPQRKSTITHSGQKNTPV